MAIFEKQVLKMKHRFLVVIQWCMPIILRILNLSSQNFNYI